MRIQPTPLHHLPSLEAVVAAAPPGGSMNGDITIDPTAQIAPGVILQADPGFGIHIGAGVCVGMGSILHACGGSLRLEEGATLGVGVLLIGSVSVGSKGCVGSYSTVLNTAIEPNEIIPPGSLVGDESRRLEGDPVEPVKADPQPVNGYHPHVPSTPMEKVQQSLDSWQEAKQQSEVIKPPEKPAIVGIPGQADLNRLLNRIVPYRNQH